MLPRRATTWRRSVQNVPPPRFLPKNMAILLPSQLQGDATGRNNAPTPSFPPNHYRPKRDAAHLHIAVHYRHLGLSSTRRTPRNQRRGIELRPRRRFLPGCSDSAAPGWGLPSERGAEVAQRGPVEDDKRFATNSDAANSKVARTRAAGASWQGSRGPAMSCGSTVHTKKSTGEVQRPRAELQ